MYMQSCLLLDTNSSSPVLQSRSSCSFRYNLLKSCLLQSRSFGNNQLSLKIKYRTDHLRYKQLKSCLQSNASETLKMKQKVSFRCLNLRQPLNVYTNTF